MTLNIESAGDQLFFRVFVRRKWQPLERITLIIHYQYLHQGLTMEDQAKVSSTNSILVKKRYLQIAPVDMLILQ